MDIAQRLPALRAELAARGLDGLVIPLTDEHMSEYVGAYARRLEWLTGFKGSAGNAVVTRDRAAIFTDGRYTVQVRAQVDGTAWEYVDVPADSVAGWVGRNASGRIGYDPWLVSEGWVAEARAALAGRGELVPVSANPIDAVWADRPAPSPSPVEVYDDALAGRSGADKRQEIADWLRARNLDATVMTALDSVAWTFNLRGRDVARTPVGLAFALIHDDGTADLFLDGEKLTPEVTQALGNGVRVSPRDGFAAALGELGGKRVAVDPERATAAVFDALRGAEIVRLRDPAVLAKAIKNPVEAAGHRAAQARDGAAITRFLRWLDAEAPKGGLTEIAASDRLEQIRREDRLLADLSFDTISAAGGNAALPHYKAEPETQATIPPSSIYLVDSGGQYRDGTTDITRTVWIGPGAPSAEMRDRFTRVLKGHIALATATFPDGTTGGQLDVLARQFLWRAGVDYAHGTGHGVGAFLSVHEGPQRIAKPSGGQAGTAEPLRAGMILSNEPGYYKPGAFGIRIENLVLVEPRAIDGAEGAMLGFETLTFAPIDRRLIEPELMTPDEIAWLDNYHAAVLARIGPGLEGEDRAWLETACAAM